jgi:hypothetical protein
MISTPAPATTDSTAMRAFYEVNRSSCLIRTPKPIEFGKPITHDFGKY